MGNGQVLASQPSDDGRPTTSFLTQNIVLHPAPSSMLTLPQAHPQTLVAIDPQASRCHQVLVSKQDTQGRDSSSILVLRAEATSEHEPHHSAYCCHLRSTRLCQYLFPILINTVCNVASDYVAVRSL